MGVRGAAIATVIGQLVAAALGIILNLKFNTDIRLHLKNFIPRAKILGEMLAIGIPSVLMQAIGSVMTFCMNKVLISFPDCGVAAMNVFGIYFKLQSFVLMPIFGMNNGMGPIIAYNYGARNKKRMINAIKVALIIALSVMFVGLLLMQIFPETALRLFNANEDMLALGVPALRTISLSFMFAGLCIVLGSSFQALGKGVYSMVVSIARQLVVLIPAAYLFSLTGKVNMVWWSFPLAEIASVTFSIILFIHLYKTTISKIDK